MKKWNLSIFLTSLISSLLLISSALAKTVSAQIYGTKISDVSSNIISLNSSDLTLIVFLNKTGGLQGIRMKTQGVDLRINPEGRIVRQSLNGRNIPILYTDTSYQHISQVGNIPIRKNSGVRSQNRISITC